MTTTATRTHVNPVAAAAAHGINPVKIPQGQARSDPPTSKQISLAKNLGLDVDPSQLTKGQISDLLTEAQHGLKIPQGEARGDPATKAQRELAHRLAASGKVDASKIDIDRPDLTKGEISDFISSAQETLGAVNPVKIPQEDQRSEPPTAKQLELAKSLGASEEMLQGLNKGQVSDWITEKQTSKATEAQYDRPVEI